MHTTVLLVVIPLTSSAAATDWYDEKYGLQFKLKFDNDCQLDWNDCADKSNRSRQNMRAASTHHFDG